MKRGFLKGGKGEVMLSSGVIPITRSEDEDVPEDDEGKTMMERDGCGDEEVGVHR